VHYILKRENDTGKPIPIHLLGTPKRRREMYINLMKFAFKFLMKLSAKFST